MQNEEKEIELTNGAEPHDCQKIQVFRGKRKDREPVKCAWCYQPVDDLPE